MRYKFPKSHAGLKVGLFGGSFDPAHDGHLNVCLHALKRFNLDQIWLLISVQNPLKDKNPSSLDKRVLSLVLLSVSSGFFDKIFIIVFIYRV